MRDKRTLRLNVRRIGFDGLLIVYEAVRFCREKNILTEKSHLIFVTT